MSTTENIHDLLVISSVLFGAARMLRSESAKQSFNEAVLKLVGYTLAVGGIECVFVHVVQLVPSTFVVIITGSVRVAVSHYGPVAIRTLLEQSSKFRALAEANTVLGGSYFGRPAAYNLLGGLMALLVGVVEGALVTCS